jgi:tetratricopeptide (TPR) repeat protein
MTWGIIRAQIRRGVRPAEAEKPILRNMLEAYRQLLAEPGRSREQRATAAEAAFRTANLYALLGDSADAEAGYRRAIDRYDALAQEFPGEPEYANELARCHFDLAILLGELGKQAGAEAAYRRAIELHDRMVAAFPGEPAYRSELADACNNLGTLLRDNQELAAAEAAFRRAVALGEQAAAEMPGESQYRINLAAACHNLGNVVRDQGHPADALPWYARAIALLADLDPRPDDATLFLRNACWDRASALGQLGRHGEACSDWQRALDLDPGPEREHLRLFLAAAQMEAKLRAASKPAGSELYDGAVVHARAAAAATATAEGGLYQQHVRRCLALLQQAKAAGWFQEPQRIQQLASEGAFAALPLDDFHRLLASLAGNKE